LITLGGFGSLRSFCYGSQHLRVLVVVLWGFLVFLFSLIGVILGIYSSYIYNIFCHSKKKNYVPALYWKLLKYPGGIYVACSVCTVSENGRQVPILLTVEKCRDFKNIY
jgi:hypothetical protein